MDLSKLPRLSKTETPAPNENHAVEPSPDPPPAARPVVSHEPRTGHGPEAWISLVIVAFLLFMYPRFLQWASSRIFHTHFGEFMLDDKVVPYQTVPEFWMDLGPVLFGIVLLLDGIVLLAMRRRGLVAVVFVLTVLATLYNLGYMVLSFGRYGFAPISFLATAFGAYIAWFQWRILKEGRGETAGA
ncbi:MAG TPA: hypothetical protein VGI81_15100 [Tepidisphaeraceae bacterium]